MRHRPIALDPAEVQVKISGGIRSGDVRRAREIVADLARLAHEPVLDARIKLTHEPGSRDAAKRCTARAVLDVQGRLIRAEAGARTTRAAIHLLADRLRARLLEATRDWENRRGRHHGRRLSPDRSDKERRIVRTFATGRALPDEAVVDMVDLDHDFLLFTEATTGQDSVVHRIRDGYRLAQLVPRPDLPAPICAAISISPLPAPRLTVEQAVERLELTGSRFVFFADAETGAGCVVHQRDDGDYGLVVTVH
ncbi:HPF/RaiA family ribosome-associated protein [Nonomuraea sp. NPDC048892]|uniref:HPF/RaiA family ribosome-associated protein n=1 Tax=Nonomuraea sp. NPDC048892 TaxID=3154624 RepID=UPI0033F4E7A5